MPNVERIASTVEVPSRTTVRPPAALLFDYGGTLVEEAGYDARAGIEALLGNAIDAPTGADLEKVFARAERISAEVAARRDEFHIEVPWASLTRLIHDVFGTRFTRPLAELELVFWNASVTTRPMPGARETLLELQKLGIAMGVVSNTSFSSGTIRHDLSKHDLAAPLAIVVASSEYGVRKPNPLLFEVAAARIGVAASDIWFVGDRLDTDVAGARAAGMRAILYGGSDGAAAGAGVRSWGELSDLVRGAIGSR